MQTDDLAFVARSLVAKGKGLLAADESLPTIEKRFAALGIPSNEETRRAYRDMLLSTPGIEEFISGVILFDETLHQKAGNGISFVQTLVKKGIIPGIKVDMGTVPLPGFPGEKITTGLDGLEKRLNEYRTLGARFTKWRAVLTIGPDIPTYAAMTANATLLAIYAAHAQEAGLVPIVEPEVLMDGDHGIERCEQVTREMLDILFGALGTYRIFLEGMLLKPNMVLAGKQSTQKAEVKEAAEATIRTLRRTVPSAVPGIVFLSGGQSPESATEHLNAMNKMGPHPWEISFSFARALQDYAMKEWAGSASNRAAAQRAFYIRARYTSEARNGFYGGEAMPR
ncbi:MAG: class I fructose-bisphosphate aldolase [Nitrospirota bacterium]